MSNEKGVLETLGILDKEDVISNLIAYCLKKNTKFQQRFLETIGINEGIYKNVLVRRKIKGVGIPDFIIIYYLRDKLHAKIIENKLKANEGKNQTERYSNIPKIKDFLSDNKYKNISVDTKGIFLTLYYDQTKCKDFDSLSYKEIYPLFDKLENIGKGYNELINDLHEQLKRFYECKYKDEDAIQKVLKENKNSYLDNSYNYFVEMITNTKLNIPNDFVITYEREQKSGRVDYVAHIYKKNWMRNEYSKQGFNKNIPNYRIYFHIAYNTKNNQLVVKLHYTTNPYGKMDIVKKLEKEGNKYIYRREMFRTSIKENDLKEIEWHVSLKNTSITDTNTKLIIAEPNINRYSADMTIKEFTKNLKTDVEKLGVIITTLLSMVD